MQSRTLEELIELTGTYFTDSVELNKEELSEAGKKYIDDLSPEDQSTIVGYILQSPDEFDQKVLDKNGLPPHLVRYFIEKRIVDVMFED